MMGLQRYLSDLEVQLSNAPTAFIADYRGRLDTDALRRVFGLLRQRHPVLRARIATDHRGQLLYVPQVHADNVTVIDGDENSLKREIAGNWDSAHTVSQLIIGHGMNHGFVALRADHAIADGRSCGSMFNELWQLYSDMVGGVEILVQPGATLPCAPNEVLSQRGIEASPPANSSETPTRNDLTRAHIYRVRLSKDDTSQIVGAARYAGASVHALVCSAVLTTLRGFSSVLGPAPMVCWSNIDLRNRVSPPVGATETTNLGTRHRCMVTVSDDTDPVLLSRKIKRQLDDFLSSRNLLVMDRSLPLNFDTPLDGRISSVLVSNVGVLPRFAQPEDLVIDDFRVERGDITYLKIPQYGVYTYDGRLCIKGAYPFNLFADREAQRLTTDIGALLRGIGSSQPRRSAGL